MAPDTEPTDEELEEVMVAALELARKRRALSDAWVAARLAEATELAQRASPNAARRGADGG